MNWYSELKTKLDAYFKVQNVWFDYDSGQLNPNPNGVFSVAFPCALLRLDRVSNFETVGNKALSAIASVSIRFAVKSLEKTHNQGDTVAANMFPTYIEFLILTILRNESLQGNQYEVVKIEAVNRENRSDLQVFVVTISLRCILST